MWRSNTSSRQEGGRRGSGRRSNGVNGRNGKGARWGEQRQQEQMYAMETQMLEQQVVLLDQMKKCFRLVDMHLENIANNEDAQELDDSACTMVTGLNLVRLAVGDLKDNEKAFSAGKSELAKFLSACEGKYNGVPGEGGKKLMGVVTAVRDYIGCALSGGDVPVMQINGLDQASHNDSALANSAMRFVALGAHQERDLRRDVRSNPKKYSDQVEEEARNGANFDEAFDVPFNESSQQVLQGDMMKLTPFANESQGDAEKSLHGMLARRREPVEIGGGDSNMEDVSRAPLKSRWF